MEKYADNFNGMCVAYDFSNASDELLRKLYPVQYTFTGFRCENNMKPLINPYYYLRKAKNGNLNMSGGLLKRGPSANRTEM